MNSRTTAAFRRMFQELPVDVQALARKAHRLWLVDPHYRGLHYKKVHPTRPIFSVRIGIAWRAMGVLNGDEMTWFFIGSHSEYDDLLKHL